jgi:myosin heavy chain 1/2/3/4/8/13/7B/15
MAAATAAATTAAEAQEDAALAAMGVIRDSVPLLVEFNRKLKEENGALQKQIDERDEKIKDLNRQHDAELDDDSKGLSGGKGIVAEERKIRAELERAKRRLELEVDELNATSSDLERLKRRLGAEVEDLTTRLETSERNRTSAEKKAMKYESESKSAHRRASDALNQQRRAEREAEFAKRELEKNTDRLREAEELAAEAEKEREKLGWKCNDLQGDLDIAQDRLRRETAANEELKSKYAKLDRKVKVLLGE